jgi:hypothetical protein
MQKHTINNHLLTNKQAKISRAGPYKLATTSFTAQL